MSSWPLISDFARVLQNPQVAFRDPQYRTAKVEMNQIGQPKARSGNFATVYRGFHAEGREFAIRVFNRRQDERLEHYRTISRYLEHRHVSSIVPFEYDDRGIRSAGDGRFYPLLIMDWVPGITLFEWTRDRSREGYVEALQIAADVWLHLVRELGEHRIVHGDLQHGNVMVSPEGHFKLVDYDCMCVPELIGRRNLETGLPPYQHPGRNADTELFSGLDHFSSLVIYVALRALAAEPQLWQKYVDQPEYDRILFRSDDFEHPGASPLRADLMQSPDEQVRDLAHYLFELARYDLHDIPPVDEVLLWCESVESLIVDRDWSKVVQLVQRMGPGEQIEPQWQPYVQEAQRRVACRQALEAALAEGNEDRVEQLYATGLLNDWPEAADLAVAAADAARVRPLLRVLASAQQLRAWDKLKATWIDNQHLLAGRKSAQVYGQEVQKLLTVDRIRECLASSPVDDRTLLEAWEYLERLGGHPIAEPYRQQVEVSAARVQGVARLQALLLSAPPTPTLAHDKRVAAALPPEAAARLDPASPLAEQVAAAQQRLHYVARVHDLEKAGTIEAERYIATVTQYLPEGYHDGLLRRVEQARKRLFVYGKLVKALREPCIESQIVRAWQALGKVRGRVLAADQMQRRAELAEQRAPLVEALQAIPEALDAAELERRVLEIWVPELLDECRQANRWKKIYERSQTRRSLLREIGQALETEDLGRVEQLLADPSLQNAELPPQLAGELGQLRVKSQQAALAKRQAIVTALLNNERGVFAELFDAHLVGQICQQFRHHQPVVTQWVEEEILPLSQPGFAADPEHAVTRDEEDRLHILWQWPAPRISNLCCLAICRTPPPEHVIPDDVDALHKATVQRAQWDPHVGYVVPMEPDWEDSRVYVWAVVELGFQQFFSAPLEAGQVKALTRQTERRWGLFWRRRREDKDRQEAALQQASQDADAGDDEQA
jgi:hypothetical protein